jgi:4-alpha-glucanotransferase
VAGVPPDYFSPTGQLWGNPVYDWDTLGATGYAWWIQRVRALLAQVDLVRLDHFRAFAAAWHVPAEARTAEMGEWMPGPGTGIFSAFQAEFGCLPLIAEDLGLITPDVVQLRDQFQIPSTRVLQFAFDGDPDNIHLPENYTANTVVYTGTHDNATTREWFQSLPERDRHTFWEYRRQPEGEFRDVAPQLIQLAWASRATLAIAPFQDLLNLGSRGRMNTPGTSAGNWRWRATRQMLATSNFGWLKDQTRISKRVQSPSRGAGA